MLVEVSLEHIPMQAQMCFDATTEGITGRLLATCPSSYSWSVIPTLTERGLSASFASAAAAGVGVFSLLAVLVYIADEYPAIYARAGTQALEASIVRLYVVLMIVGWFFGDGRADALDSLVSIRPPYGPGSGVRQHPRGHFFTDALSLTRLLDLC